MKVTPEEITIIARMVNDLCGVILDETKGYLIESRLSEVAESEGCSTFSEFYYKARYKTDKHLQRAIIDAITTQETLFFRDGSPFEALQYKLLPEMIDAKAATAFPKKFRIWSAACSTGQEPYSIAMMFHEMLPDVQDWDISIMATDISDTAIAQASLGEYAAHEIQRGLKPELLSRYFLPKDDKYKVKDELRAMIMFKQINLHNPFVGMGPFDIIFCRNVAIYFDQDAKRSLFLRLGEKLTREGIMFVGSSESLTDVGPQFIPQHHCRAVFYQPNVDHSVKV